MMICPYATRKFVGILVIVRCVVGAYDIGEIPSGFLGKICEGVVVFAVLAMDKGLGAIPRERDSDCARRHLKPGDGAIKGG